jgi:hypothetical protein
MQKNKWRRKQCASLAEMLNPWQRCLFRGLTPPSSGQLSASRQLPLMSNVRRRCWVGGMRVGGLPAGVVAREHAREERWSAGEVNLRARRKVGVLRLASVMWWRAQAVGVGALGGGISEGHASQR